MSNQITILNSQNQEETVELISYFQNNNNNKKYLFYTKNEVVQDGLIKIYVAEGSNGLVTEITPDEWNEIKGIMQDIIREVTNNG